MADADDTARYHVEIDAPASVKGAVERSLDLVRWQSYAGLTPELLELLIADAKAQARDAAAAQGLLHARRERRARQHHHAADGAHTRRAR